MDLVLKGRELRITDPIRRMAEHKLAKLGRLDPRVSRVEVELIGDQNPRTGGRFRVEVACQTGRRVIRAHGQGNDVDSALDEVVRRLERQITSYRERLRTRVTAGARRLRATRPAPEPPPPPT